MISSVLVEYNPGCTTLYIIYTHCTNRESDLLLVSVCGVIVKDFYKVYVAVAPYFISVRMGVIDGE